MNHPSRKTMRILATLSIWTLMTAVWGFVWYEYYADIIKLPFYRRGNWMIIAVYGILLFIITQFYGGYHVGYYRRGDILFSCLMSMVVTNGITYLQTSLVDRNFINGMPIIWMSVVDFILIWVWATAADKFYQNLNPPRQLLCIYGGSDVARSMITKMAVRDDKYIIQEVINIDEGLLAVLERLKNYQSVLICDIKSSHRNRLLNYCYEHNIRVYIMPKISDIIIRGAGSIHLFDSPLLIIRNNSLSPEQQISKRIFDIVASALAFLFFSPFMLLVAILIKFYDGGPIFYTQERLTINGRRFQIYKFRSMIVDAEKKGVQLANQNDDRVTPVGKIIRKIRFDELPQLINIIKGDMSIVGPRPERPEIAEEYKKYMDDFDFRLKVKAGLTGYAQILGKYNTTPYDKLKLDMMYITGYSFMLDIKIILMTIKILFIGQSTEGIKDGSNTA